MAGLFDQYPEVNSDAVGPLPAAPKPPKGLFDAYPEVPASVSQPRAASGVLESIQAGFQGSAPGLAWRGKLPDLVIDPQHASWWERALSGATHVGAELPLMIGGAIAGAPAGAAIGTAVAPGVGTAVGSLLGAGAGMGAVPAAIRQTLIEAYKSGDVMTAADFWNSVREVAKTTATEAGINAAAMGAGAVAGRVVGKAIAPAIGQSISVPTAIRSIEAADIATQIAAMPTIPAILQGRLPDAQEFVDAAILIGGLKAAHVTASNITSVFLKTGKTPAEQVADAQANPDVAKEMAEPKPAASMEPEYVAPSRMEMLKVQENLFTETARLDEMAAKAEAAPLSDPERIEMNALKSRVLDLENQLRAGAPELSRTPTYTADQFVEARKQADTRLAELTTKAETEALTDTERAERVFLSNSLDRPTALAKHFGFEPILTDRPTPQAIDASAQRIHDDVLQQLKDADEARKAAGLEPLGDDHARAVAALVRTRVRARAERLGVLPESLYAERPVKIEDVNKLQGESGKFELSDEWQVVPDGTVLPSGTETRSSFVTGVTEARRMPGADSPIPQPSGSTGPELDLFGEPIQPPPMESQNQVATIEPAMVPVAGLTLSKDVPQFKAGANAKGVVEPLGGAWDPTGVGPIQIWQRLNGAMEVISGRHRLDKAQREGVADIWAQVHKESEGFTRDMAAALDAMLNIRDGQGSVADYAQFFKAAGLTKDAADRAGLLARGKGKSGFAIARDASPDLLASHRAGNLSDEAALVISSTAPGSERLQALGIAAVQEGKTLLYASNLMRSVDMMAAERMMAGEQGDIFGFDDSALKEASAMAKKASSKQRAISEQIAAVSGASKRPELARKMGVNVEDPAAVQAKIIELKNEQYLWDNWPLYPELVKQLRGEVLKQDAIEPQPIKINVDDLSKGILSRMSLRLQSMGYDIRGSDDVRMLLKTKRAVDGVLSHPDWIRAYEAAVNGAKEARERVDAKAAERNQAANVDFARMRELGLTEDWREAGYITPRGSLVDLSGKREGGTPGERAYDHREAGGTAGMQEYMAIGNIRIDANSGMIDISREPTPEQYRRLLELVEDRNGDVVIDLENGLGQPRDDGTYARADQYLSRQHDAGTSPKRIIGEIRAFFNNRTLKQGPVDESPLKPETPAEAAARDKLAAEIAQRQNAPRQQDETQTPEFKAWSHDAPFISSAEANTHEFKTGEKIAVEAYHGTGRPDRVGEKFLRKRATSGPMAFHTNDPDIASGYAKGKADTSISYEDTNYPAWFKFKPKGARSYVDIERAWYSLDEATKAKIAEMAPKISHDPEGSGEIVVREDNKSGNGSYDYNLQQTQRGYDKRGNPLKALVDDWLNSGVLYNDEPAFLQVLKIAGFPVKDIHYDDPHSSQPFVYKNYIQMQRPLVTSDIPPEVMDALAAAAKRDRSRPAAGGADIWDKNTRTLKQWYAELTDPENTSVAYVWTSIPDKVTDVFKSLRYDGIVDTGGKGGGNKHIVYVPFSETQIKSAIGNKGTFDPSNKNILAQKQTDQLHRGSYDIAENLITQLEGADKSTVVHELGHSWLEEMKADATRPDAPADIKRDWETLRKELAIGADGEISRTSHEQFARSVERYLAEGEAPSRELQGVFARFREWLLDIYKSVMNLNVEINPELKQVLDRMLATDEEIAAARDLGVPRAYVPEAAAATAEAIVPPPQARPARRQINPGFEAEQASMQPYADELPPGPGEAPDNIHVNYAYINSPTDVKLAMQRMAEIDQANIQRQRGGTEGVKSWAEANAEQAKYLNDILGGGPDTLHLFEPRDPDAPHVDVRLGILKKLAVGAATDSARLRDVVLQAGEDATVRQKLEYMGSIERARMIQAEFLGERASVARALNALKDVTEGTGEIGRMLEAIGIGDENTMFQANRTPAEEQAFLKAKLDEILQNYKGKSVLDIAKLHKEIGTLKGTFKLAKEVSQATRWEQIVEGWRAGLLSGPVTHTTNLLGTEAFHVMRPAVDVLASIIGMARGASPGMGESDRASMSEAVARLTGMLGGVQDGIKVAIAEFKADEATGKTEAYRTAIPGQAGRIIRTPLRLMGAEDALVTTMYTRGEIRTLAIRQAFDEDLNPSTREFSERVSYLQDNPTPEMQVAAETAATRMTFNAPLGEKGVFLQGFVNKWNLQWMIPFIRTPINIAKELLRMSPFAPAIGEWRQAFAKGGVERDRALAEMALGSGIMAITMAYAFSNDDKGRQRLTGSGGPDPGKNRGKAGVWQPYSILIGDTYYEYARIQPTGTLMGMAADMAAIWDHMTDEEKDKVPRMLSAAFAQAITNQTFLQGITNFVNAMSDPARFGPRFLQQMAGSAVPNIIGQPTTMADPVVREVNSALEAIQARIPGMRQDLLPKRDWLGAPVETKERLGVVMPIREQQISDDKVRQEAARLDISMAAAPKKTHIGKGTGKLGDVELTPEERDAFEKIGGQFAHGILQNIVNAPGYDQMPDLVKRKIFSNVLSAAHRVAAVQAMPMEKRIAYLQEITEKVAQELTPGDQP